MLTTIRRFAALVVLALLLAPTAAYAQERIAVVTESGTSVIATEILIATGPAAEPAGKAGLAHLAARSVVEPIRPVLDSLGARVAIQSHKEAISFSVISAPDAWEEATRVLLVALFRDGVDSLAIEREKRAIRAELTSRATNPADVLMREVDTALFGADHPWGRPTVGTVQTVQRLTVSDVDGFLTDNFLPDRAIAVVVGPILRDRAMAHLLPFMHASAWQPPEQIPAKAATLPIRREYPAITTWVSVNYPFTPDSDVEALRMLTGLVTSALSFGPARPSVYNVHGEVVPRADGGELRFHVVVPPQEADRWADQIQQTVTQFSGRLLPEHEFRERSRLYRGLRLAELNAPERRAQDLARRMYLHGEISALVEFEELSPQRLRSSAQSLRRPVVVFLGPS